MNQPPASAVPVFPNLGQSVLLVLGTLAIQVGAGAAIALVAMVLNGGLTSGMSVLLNPWTLAVVNCLAVGTMLRLGLRATREAPVAFFAVRPFSCGLVPAIGLTSLGLAALLAETDNLILELLQFFPQANGGSLDWFDPGSHPIGALLLLIVVAPLTEEYLFRGMILRGLLTRHRVAIAIFLSALLFGILHANLRQLFLGAVIGGVFGWWYVRTASLGPGMLGHALFNSVAYVVALLPNATHPLVQNAPGQPILHQPWWLTAAAIALIGFGLWWFDRRAGPRPRVETPPAPSDSVPPLLATTPIATSPAPSGEPYLHDDPPQLG